MSEPTQSLTRTEAIARLTAPDQPYAVESITQFGRPCRGFVNAPRSLRALYEAARSDALAFVYEQDRYSYESLWQQASRIARVLIDDYDVAPGDRVAISMRNYPEWIMCFMATTSIGAVAVAMNALWNAEEMAFGLEDSGAKVLFADQERLDRWAELSKPPAVAVVAVRPRAALPTDVPLLADLLAQVPEGPMPPAVIEPDDDATILYTSGSSGQPKGAVSCHRNVISALLSWELDGQIGMAMNPSAAAAAQTAAAGTQQPATLLAVPLFHVTGLHAVMLGSFRAQRRVVSMYKWDVEQAMAIIEQEQISSFVAPAAMTGDLVAAARSSNRDLSSLASVGGGGAPRAPDQVKNISDAFANAMPGTGWGMTETNAIGTGIGGQDYLTRPSSSGRVSPVLDLRIVDEDGAVLPAGERGELQVTGTSVIRGYWNRPDANAEAFVDGWLRTGDVAYLDDEGFLFIVDRLKDLVIRGGENIGCGEVEAALLEHPQVIEAAVYGVPDERLGEEVGATVVVQGALDEDGLRAFVATRLARFKVPKLLRFTAEPLPRTASGKILKREIREQALLELG